MVRVDDNREAADRNYRAFLAKLPDLLETHPGQFALLRDEKVVSISDSLKEAWEDGDRRFPDQRFSIQEITDRPVDQGYYSHVVKHVFV